MVVFSTNGGVQFLLTASFPHVFESCLKFRKGREYIKSMYLVKLTVKLTLDLIVPELLCCYQEKSYRTRKQIQKGL